MPTADLKAKYGAITGSELEKELLDPTSVSARRRTTIAEQEVFLPDYYRESVRTGSFTNIQDPFERATLQAQMSLGQTPSVANVAFDPSKANLQGDLEQLATQYNVGQNVIVEARKAQATGPVVGETGFSESGEIQSYQERSALPATGTPVGTSSSYWDASRGREVYAKPGEYFELYGNGAVRIKQGSLPQGSTGAPASSLFTQPTTNEGTPVAGFKEEKLGYEPVEGKEIQTVSRSVFNPKTGVNEYAGEGEVLIKYTDGTVERRQFGAAPGQAVPIEEFGRTEEELGITRRTEIKDESGAISRAPYSAREALERATTPEEKDKVLQEEGLKSTGELELVGKQYGNRIAKEGYLFYQDPETRTILERPEELKSLAQPTTSPSLLARKQSISDMFQTVFGREPSDEEAAYWYNRWDKSGAALLGAMQYAKQNEKTVAGKTATQQGALDLQSIISQGGTPDQIVSSITNTANKSQQERMAAYESGNQVAYREVDQGVAAAKKGLEGVEEPEVGSAIEFTKEQLANTQFQQATDDLNRAKNALRQLDSSFRNTLVQQERTPGLSMGAIRRNQGEMEIVYNRQRAELIDELQAYTDIVNSQMAITDMMIDAFKYDQQTAQQEYVNRFNKATALYQMAVGEREYQFEQEKFGEEKKQFAQQIGLQQEQLGLQQQQFAYGVRKDAIDQNRQNLGVIMGLIQEGTLDYSKMNPSNKAQIQYMEQQVGLSGITQAIANTNIPPVVSVGSTITGTDGIPRTQIISQNPRTGELSISYFEAPFASELPAQRGGGGATALQKNIQLAREYGIDPVNVIEQNIGLPLTRAETQPFIGPLQGGILTERPQVSTGTRVPIKSNTDYSNYRTLGDGLYNLETGQYIPPPDSGLY